MIGMSGGLLAEAAGHELGRPLFKAKIEQLQKRAGVVYKKLLPSAPVARRARFCALAQGEDQARTPHRHRADG